MASPLYALLLDRAVEDVEREGVAWRTREPHTTPGRRGSALELRLMAAVHRLVLTGRAPALAAHCPSVGGHGRGDPWPAFHDALVEHAQTLRHDVARPCQTNEVGRCAALILGFLDRQPGQRRHVLTLRQWPGGDERLLAHCGAHGTNVRTFVA